MKKNFVGGAVVIAVTAVAAKAIGALYRIPLTAVIGAEGIGMYQLIFPVYALFITLTSGAASASVSRLVAETLAKGENPSRYLKTALAVFSAAGAAGALLLAALSGTIAGLQGNGLAVAGYFALSPAVFFVAVSSAMKGYYQGFMEMRPSAFVQIAEQLLKLVIGLMLSRYFFKFGLAAAVAGAALGVTLSEIGGAVFLSACMPLLKGKTAGLSPCRDNCAKKIVSLSVPILLGGITIPAGFFVDSLIMVNLLKYTGLSTAAATAQYGLLSGTVSSIVNMPSVIIVALAVAVMPTVSKSRTDRDLEAVILKSATSIKLALIVGLPATVLCFALADNILPLLYPTLGAAEIKLAAVLLKISSLGIAASAQMYILNALLQALDKTYVPLKNMLAALAVKTVITVTVTLKAGIAGAAIAVVVMNVLTTILNANYLNALVGKNLKLVKNVSEIMLSGVIITIVALPLSAINVGNAVNIIITSLSVAAVYLLCLMAFKVFDKTELEGLPLGKLAAKFYRKV